MSNYITREKRPKLSECAQRNFRCAHISKTLAVLRPPASYLKSRRVLHQHAPKTCLRFRISSSTECSNGSRSRSCYPQLGLRILRLRACCCSQTSRTSQSTSTEYRDGNHLSDRCRTCTRSPACLLRSCECRLHSCRRRSEQMDSMRAGTAPGCWTEFLQSGSRCYWRISIRIRQSRWS